MMIQLQSQTMIAKSNKFREKFADPLNCHMLPLSVTHILVEKLSCRSFSPIRIISQFQIPTCSKLRISEDPLQNLTERLKAGEAGRALNHAFLQTLHVPSSFEELPI